MPPSVAIIGANGILGAPVIEALTSRYCNRVSLPVKAITRSANGKVSNEKVSYIEADLLGLGLDELYGIFQGTDVIIELTGTNPQVFRVVEQIVAYVRPSLFIPSQFSCEIDALDKYLPGFLAVKADHSEFTRMLGVKTVDIISAMLAVPGSYLYEIVDHAGVNPDDTTVTYFGNPDFKFGVTKLADISNTIAEIATFHDYSKIPDKVRVYSHLVSQREVARRYEASHNIKLKELRSMSKAESLVYIQDKWAKGYNAYDFITYLQAIIAQGENKGLAFSQENEREFVNPGESLWKWEKF